MGELLRKMNQFAATLCGYFLALLMVMLLLDIILRTAGHPIIGVGELSMFVMFITVYLGMGDCERTGNHIKVNFLTERMSPSTKKFFGIFTGLLCTFMLIVCTYAMAINTLDSYEGDEAIAGLIAFPVWPVKFIMTMGITLYTLQNLYNFYLVIKEKA